MFEQQQNKKEKRRGTISLNESKGPPEGLFHHENRILTIGDGDLSFSFAVSRWLKYLNPNIKLKFVATTYDSLKQLEELYSVSAMKHILSQLHKYEVKVLHEIDVSHLLQYKGEFDGIFDRIVWNFPHAGFPKKNYGPGFQWETESHDKHISLIKCFFKFSRQLLEKQGLVIMSHKTVPPFSLWNIQKIGEDQGYKLIKTHKFNIEDYPGYENRRGEGKNGGKTFPIDDAVTYVFSMSQ